MTALLEIRSVTKFFEGQKILSDISLTIPQGDFFSILGPSGCGKTTLLRILAGFEQPDTGQVLFSGQDLTRHSPQHRPFNMVFQRYALFPHLTVGDNVAFGILTFVLISLGIMSFGISVDCQWIIKS